MSFDEDDLPLIIKAFIENSKRNSASKTGNRYDEEIIKLSMWIFIRAGRSFYEFMRLNTNLPCAKTLERHMLKYQSKLEEGVLDFDGVVEMLKSYNLPMEIAILEDGTKITEVVEYDSTSNVLLELVSPFNPSTGMPEARYFKADSAQNIQNAIEKHIKAKYVQVIIAKPNKIGKFRQLYFCFFT